jgi:hypothetical protein
MKDECVITLDTFRAAMGDEHGHLAFSFFGGLTGYVNRSS